MRRITSLLLAICLLAICIPVSAAAPDTVITYTLKPGETKTLCAEFDDKAAERSTWKVDDPHAVSIVSTDRDTCEIKILGSAPMEYVTVTCSYSYNINVGGWSYPVSGSAEFHIIIEDEVVRLAGENRFATSLLVADELKSQLGVEKFNSVIIASGNDFADALAGSYLSTVKSAPILLSWGKGGDFQYLDDNNVAYIRENLDQNGTVYILGGENAVPKLYEEALSGYRVKRLGGKDRSETNLLILKEAGVKAGEEILVCTATNFADSLSASATGKPILLVFNSYGKLYGGQPAYLASLKECSFTVVGGESAVSRKLADAVSKYGEVERLAGKNRFETSVLVARRFFRQPRQAVLAYAWNYPDGLCGGALAYAMGAPLLLTMTQYEEQAADHTTRYGISSGMVLGGEGLISEPSVERIFQGSGGLHVYTTAVTVTRGDTFQVIYDYAGKGKLMWQALEYDKLVNGDVVAVDSKGVITGLEVGQAWVYVTDGRHTAYIRVTVEDVILQPNSAVALKVGDSHSLEWTYNGVGKLTWSSKNESIAKVDQTGKVTAVGPGWTSIVLSDGYKSRSCRVTVLDKNSEIGKLVIHTFSDMPLYIGESRQIDYTYTGDASKLRFESVQPDNLTVDQNGVVTGITYSLPRVRIYHGDTLLGSVRFAVQEKPSQEVPPMAEEIIATSFTGPYFEGVLGVVGNHMGFFARGITPGDAPYQKVVVTSSNPEVVGVRLDKSYDYQNGSYIIDFKAPGTAVITVTSEDGRASLSYTIGVRAEYDCPIGGQLTPEEFVACANGVMVENGATINTTIGWRMLALTDDELTGSRARSLAEGWVREFWPLGIRAMGLAYQGMNENGKHVFYIHC